MVLRVLKKGERAVNEMKTNFVDLSVIDEGDAGFGILVRCPSGDEWTFHSVCLRRSDSERICETVNRLGVSECHIRDVIEDLLP